MLPQTLASEGMYFPSLWIPSARDALSAFFVFVCLLRCSGNVADHSGNGIHNAGLEGHERRHSAQSTKAERRKSVLRSTLG